MIFTCALQLYKALKAACCNQYVTLYVPPLLSIIIPCTHRPLSSSFWGLPYRILNINHKKELLRGLWVGLSFSTASDVHVCIVLEKRLKPKELLTCGRYNFLYDTYTRLGHAILYYTILYYTIYYTILYYTILYQTILDDTRL